MDLLFVGCFFVHMQITNILKSTARLHIFEKAKVLSKKNINGFK